MIFKTSDKIKFKDYTGLAEHLTKWKRKNADGYWIDWWMHRDEIETIINIRDDIDIEIKWKDGHSSNTEVNNLILMENIKNEVKVYGIVNFCKEMYR